MVFCKLYCFLISLPRINEKKMKLISLLIPTYNEEGNIDLLYNELIKIIDANIDFDWEILFINDGSTDNTLHIIKKLREIDKRVCFVDLSRNFGKEAAMLAGFDYVRGDSVIIMDADMQDKPSLIPEMVKYWLQGYDDVYAKRKSRGKESWIRKKLSKLFYNILQKTTRVEILKNVGDFRLLDRKCIEALKSLRESERYTKGLFCWIGFKKKEIIFDRGNRYSGNSSWTLGNLFDLAVEGITSFTVSPLRISTYIGIITSLAAFLYMLYFLIKTLLYGDVVQGFPTLIIIILFLGGIQLLSLGIIGEYLGRIFNESKHRPTYIVNESEM